MVSVRSSISTVPGERYGCCPLPSGTASRRYWWWSSRRARCRRGRSRPRRRERTGSPRIGCSRLAMNTWCGWRSAARRLRVNEGRRRGVAQRRPEPVGRDQGGCHDQGQRDPAAHGQLIGARIDLFGAMVTTVRLVSVRPLRCVPPGSGWSMLGANSGCLLPRCAAGVDRARQAALRRARDSGWVPAGDSIGDSRGDSTILNDL
jgi:hypothetical protein